MYLDGEPLGRRTLAGVAITEASSSRTSGSQIYATLWRAYRALLARADESYTGIGLCDSDFRVLDTLLHQGTLPVNAIGGMVELTTGSITTAIDRLEAKWLVARKSHATDRRVRLVELTAKGRRLIERGRLQHAKDLDEAVSGLSTTERETLLKLLGRICADKAAKSLHS